MSQNRLTFDGLDELRAALKSLPADLTEEAGDIVVESTTDAAAAIEGRYPKRSGRLKRGVKAKVTTSGFTVVGIVTNTAPHANIFENGTEARHTAIGANRGSMPPGHVFVPIVARFRRAMYDDLKGLLVEHGLIVTGDA